MLLTSIVLERLIVTKMENHSLLHINSIYHHQIINALQLMKLTSLLQKEEHEMFVFPMRAVLMSILQMILKNCSLYYSDTLF